MSAPAVNDLAVMALRTDKLNAARTAFVEARQMRAVRDDHNNKLAEEAARLDLDTALDEWAECVRDCE